VNLSRLFGQGRGLRGSSGVSMGGGRDLTQATIMLCLFHLIVTTFNHKAQFYNDTTRSVLCGMPTIQYSAGSGLLSVIQ